MNGGVRKGRREGWMGLNVGREIREEVVVEIWGVFRIGEK